jgi:signal peptidase II
MSRRLRLVLLSVVILATAACDQATKHVTRVELTTGVEHQVVPGVVSLELAANRGAFLGLGAGLPAGARAVLSAGVVVLLLVVAGAILRDPTASTSALLGVALLVAGGCSNLVDRIAFSGRVTDFLFIRVGPLHTGIFNVADVAILAGAIVLGGWSARRGLG